MAIFNFFKPKPAIQKKLNEPQINVENIELNDGQKEIFNRLEDSTEHFFITGEAGTGKSVLLQYVKKHSKKSLIVGVFTGVAALNVGAQTLNSLFGLPFGFIHLDKLRVTKKVATLLRHIDVVVIDEISMVRADMMDAIDFLLREARGNDIPFGGVQLVMFGDLYQLPPVVSDRALNQYFAHNHGGPYFFNALVWKKAKLAIFELTRNVRQKDDENFRTLLNSIRRGETLEHVLSAINERKVSPVPEDGVITLATKNDIVEIINNRRLNQISEKLYEYHAEITGDLEKSAFPAEEFLRLKKGAQVMFLKNDTPGKRWVNGTLGTVLSLSESEIKVAIDGIPYSVARQTLYKVRYFYDIETRRIKEEPLSSFTQFPLGLAWAFTIHKSQGKTYNSIVLDIGDGAFAHGQTYVGLSRCRSLNGVHLKRAINREDIIVDQIVISFMLQAHITKVD